ncbi:MAG: hypothetical protein AAGC81_09385 [Pseudomonadota bacterium]
MEPFIAEFAPITETVHDKTVDDIYGVGHTNEAAEETHEYKMVVMGGGGVGDTFEFRDSLYDHPDDIDLFPAGLAKSADRSFDELANQAVLDPLPDASFSDDLFATSSFDNTADLILG